jgi:hypothetical protein
MAVPTRLEPIELSSVVIKHQAWLRATRDLYSVTDIFWLEEPVEMLFKYQMLYKVFLRQNKLECLPKVSFFTLE